MKYLKDIKDWQELKNQVVVGDCLEGMKRLPDNSVDAIVTDPPYGLSFMGKKWDYDVPSKEIWKEALRVLKPGGHLLSFAGSRTYHRMAVNIEDGGFEIRDQIMWVYGSGFPKSLSIGKAINKLETQEWSKIGKALDNIDQESKMEVWKRYLDNAKSATQQLSKSKIIAGQDTPREIIVQAFAVVKDKPEDCSSPVNIAKVYFIDHQANETKINTVLQNVEAEIRQLQDPAKFAELLSQNPNPKSWLIFTAECDVKEWLKENTEVNHRVDEVLKTLRGNKKYSNEEITSVLCVALTDILKHTILNQSKTFQSLDTNLKTECVSAINVIITEYIMDNLISNTVSILKSKAVDKLQGNEREVVGKKHNTYDGSVRNPDNHKSPAELSNIGKWGLSKTPHGMNETKGTSQWEGWGTALKPAHEPIVVARKPLSEKSVAENVLKWGTGGINIDGCRVATDELTPRNNNNTETLLKKGFEGEAKTIEPSPFGRFPANLILSFAENEYIIKESITNEQKEKALKWIYENA